MNLFLKVIPHRKQRYDTVGDYFYNSKGWQFRVSKMKFAYVILVFIHEVIEWVWCRQNRITLRMIDKFDKEYEAARSKGVALCGCKITDANEPGFDKHAPYWKGHAFATKIEKMCAKFFGVDWKKYDRTVMNL